MSTAKLKKKLKLNLLRLFTEHDLKNKSITVLNSRVKNVGVHLDSSQLEC